MPDIYVSRNRLELISAVEKGLATYRSTLLERFEAYKKELIAYWEQRLEEAKNLTFEQSQLFSPFGGPQCPRRRLVPLRVLPRGAAQHA